MGQATGLPVHIQVMPPVTREVMQGWKESGVHSLGIHLESFDTALLHRVAPHKASLPLPTYEQAWQDAVSVFGPNQVSSYLLMGLGEKVDTLYEGCERLASIGVYPYLVPFRPIPGTPLAKSVPLAAGRAREIYEKAALILNRYGLHWRAMRAGCVRCRGCSALPDYQDALDRMAGDEEGISPALILEVVKDGPDMESAYRIRHESFVREQGLFTETDQDDLDPFSIHIVARENRECKGTVRITPLGNDAWLGSRLAVKKCFRGGIGTQLVKRAEKEVIAQGGTRFRAYIQLSRVNFFLRCGWHCVETVSEYHGRPHMLMESARVGDQAGKILPVRLGHDSVGCHETEFYGS